MAELSSADKSYIADMVAHHKEAIATAEAYLKAPMGERRANLSEMARQVITQRTGEMGQMRSMMSGSGGGSGPMMNKP